MSTVAIEVRNLTVSYQDVPVLQDISIAIPAGLLLAIAGPNGGGKTTFIKSLLGLVKPTNGSFTIFDTSYDMVRHRIAYIPQRSTVDWDFPVTALDVVLMGRYHHIGWFRRPKAEDIIKAHEALQQVNLSAYADRHIKELSGGQQQRIFLARALAQEADLYLLDEPFIGIDITTEKIIVDILRTLRDQGKTIVVVHHDLQTLSEYFDWVFLLNQKKIAFGPVEEVFMPEYICAAYGERTLFMRWNHRD